MPKQKDRDGIHTRRGRPGFIISYTDVTGRRRLKTVHCSTLTEARTLRAGLIAKVEKQKILGVGEAENDSFAKVCERYLHYQKPRLSEESYERLEGIIELHLKPAFKGKIGNLSRSKISDYVTNRLNAASPGTVQKEFNCLKHILRLAHEEWNLIPESPTKTLTLKSLRIKLPPGRVRYLHPDELITLLNHCPTWLRPIVIIALGTGLRRGNIIDLRWTQYYERIRRLAIDKTKNNERLTVHLNDIGILGLEMAAQHFGRSQIGRVFPGVTEDQVSMAFRRACKNAGITDFRFHDLRHTNASWLRMSGADIHTVAVMLGHKDIRMSMRYSHLSDDFLADSARQLDGVFSSLLQLNAAPDAALNEDRCPIAVEAEIVNDEDV